MNSELLEEILGCRTLPSLPAVAVRVIEITGNPNCRLEDLAATIQNDQGLAAKVLRTVNSSFYGLRRPCASIHKSLVLLGLGPVKTLTLGFSLVATLRNDDDDRFDYVSYWRRGLYTAVGARCVADAARLPQSDEAFLGGLLQDIGVMAMYLALGDRYLNVMNRTGGDHNKLASAELSAFEIQHPDLGAMLAQRWRLPDELVVPVKYHERPAAAPREHAPIVRCVGLGNLIHDSLTLDDPIPSLAALYHRADQWFGLKAPAVDAIIRRSAEGAKELTSLFRLDTGGFADADAALIIAHERIAECAPEAIASSEGLDALVTNPDEIDPLTGLFAKTGFASELREAFERAKAGTPFALVQIAVDNYRTLAARAGLEASDAVLCDIAALLTRSFDRRTAKPCRLGGEVFAVILPNADEAGATRDCDTFRQALHDQSSNWFRTLKIACDPLRASIGLVAVDRDLASQTEKPERLVAMSLRAVQNARAEGGDRVRSHDQRRAA